MAGAGYWPIFITTVTASNVEGGEGGELREKPVDTRVGYGRFWVSISLYTTVRLAFRQRKHLYATDSIFQSATSPSSHPLPNVVGS